MIYTIFKDSSDSIDLVKESSSAPAIETTELSDYEKQQPLAQERHPLLGRQGGSSDPASTHLFRANKQEPSIVVWVFPRLRTAQKILGESNN
jgi:hypothetical protein